MVKRDYRRFTSIKLMLRSYGKATELSLLLIMLQISAGLALLKLGNTLSDFFMLYLYPSSLKRMGYAEFKIEDSVDFSDKAYNIDYINFLRSNRDNVKGEGEEDEEEEAEDDEDDVEASTWMIG